MSLKNTSSTDIPNFGEGNENYTLHSHEPAFLGVSLSQEKLTRILSEKPDAKTNWKVEEIRAKVCSDLAPVESLALMSCKGADQKFQKVFKVKEVAEAAKTLKQSVLDLKNLDDFSETSEHLFVYRDFCEKTRKAIETCYPALFRMMSK